MNQNQIQRVVDSMDPYEAANQMASVVKNLLSLLDEETRQSFLVDLIGDEEQDKEAGLVHF